MVVTTPYDEKLKPLFAAVDGGNLEIVRSWIAAGEPLHNPKSRTDSVLADAAEAGFFSMLELLLSVDGWAEYPQALNEALKESVAISHVDNVKLLLDHGAAVNSVCWYSVFATHKRDIVTAFLEHKKDVSEIGEGIDEAEWGTAGALKEWLAHDRAPEEPMLRKMLAVLDDIYENSTWYIDRNDEYKQREEQVKATKRAERLFSLIRWTGVDTRRKIAVDDGERTEDSVFEAVVRKGTRNQLRSLGVADIDKKLLNAAALDMEWCDETKIEYLCKNGLDVNDRPDGTSSLLLAHFTKQNESVIIYLAEHGARLPPVDNDVLKEWPRHFYKYSKPRPGILLAFAKILTQDQMAVAIHGLKAAEVFGADEWTIIEDLYDSDKSQSPDAFAKCMADVKAELKGADIHPLARNFRGYCLQSDREPLPPEFVRLFGRQTKMCNFKGNECSKEIRPWIVSVLNQFIPKCIVRGAKFRYEEVADQYRYHNERPDVEFIAKIEGYDVPLVFRELKVKPKAYLLRTPISGDVYSGRLQFCHCLGRRPCSPEVIIKERKYLWFRNHIDEMVDGLFAVVDKRKKADEKERARQERIERERLEREAVEREREQKRREEAAAREEEERKRRAVAAKVAEQKAAEEMLYALAMAKAHVKEDCSHLRAYLNEIRTELASADEEQRARVFRWVEAVEKVLCKKEAWCRDPFSPAEAQTQETESLASPRICESYSPQLPTERNYWANRGWWNKH